MSSSTTTFTYGPHNHTAAELFDLFRLSKSKEVVDLAPNTLRAFHKRGLPFHRQGKAVFVSRRELNEFIRSNSNTHNSNNS